MLVAEVGWWYGGGWGGMVVVVEVLWLLRRYGGDMVVAAEVWCRYSGGCGGYGGGCRCMAVVRWWLGREEWV